MKQFLLLLIIFFSSYGYTQELTTENKKGISNFIEAVKSKDVNKLIPYINFPIRRQYPLPDIKNEAELVYRYDELFDDSITSVIVNSNIEEDWSNMGWRGIMLNSGDLWLDESSFSILRINIQSKAEREKRIAIINYDKVSLHESLKDFESPEMVLQTEKFHIRIDELKDDFYRYAVWPINAPKNAKPDLIITNGELEFMGSGGNHEYRFKNGEYVYKCQINILGTDETPPANLIVEKNGAEILFAPAQIIRN